MAVIKYSALVTDIKGKIGGTIFQKGCVSNIIRNKGKIRKIYTNKQSAQHNIFQQLRKEWSELSSANKQLWRDWAALYTKTDKFGTQRTISGFNYFESINYNLLLIGESTIAAPPVYEVPAAVPNYSLDCYVGFLGLDFGGAQDFSTDLLIVFSTGGLNSGKLSQLSEYRFMVVEDGAAIDKINIINEFGAIWPNDYAKIFAGELGFNVYAYRININSGQSSAILKVSY